MGRLFLVYSCAYHLSCSQYFSPVTAKAHGTSNFSWTAALFVDMFSSSNTNNALETQPSVVFEWNAVEYLWDAQHSRDEYIASKKFIVENCVITGLKVHPSVSSPPSTSN